MKKKLLLLILIAPAVFSQNNDVQNETFSTVSDTFYDSSGNGENRGTITDLDDTPGLVTTKQINPGTSADFTYRSTVCPIVTGTNPTCGGSDGSITIDGLNPNTSYTVNYSDDGTPISVNLTSNSSGQIIISGLNVGNYTNIVTDFPGCGASFSNVVLSGGAPASLTSITAISPVCSGSNAVYNLNGTPNATVTYNINGGSPQTVGLNGGGTASIIVPSVVVNTTFNATSIVSPGAPISENGLSASGGNNPANASGAILASGTAATGINCAYVDNINSVLIITLQHTVPAGTSITISIARDTNAGDVTITDGAANTTFNGGTIDILQQITFVTGVATNTITITRTGGVVWIDGIKYTYYPLGCTTAIADSGTVVVNQQPNAGTGGNTLVCESNATPIDLFSLITGGQTGGMWTRLTGTGGIFNAAAGTFVPAVGTTTSTFQYSLTSIAPCSNDMSVVTINIQPQANAGLDGIYNLCNSTHNAIHLDDVITGQQSGGVWAQTSGLGGTFNPMSAIFTPSVGTVSATFTYTVPGVFPCPDDVSVATVTLIDEPNAGTDGAITICDSNTSTIDLFGLITGEQSGGTWTRLTGTGGTFNAVAGTYVAATGATSSTFQYNLAAVGPCAADVSVAAININPQHIAGADGAITICNTSTSSIDLFSLITGEQPGGTWTRLTGTGGTFNALAGTFVPAPGATSSTFQYFLTGTAPCVDDVSIGTIIINVQPNAGTDGATTICDSSTASINLFGLITGEQAGGSWTRLTGTGGTFNAAAGTFVPAPGATSSTFQYSLTGAAPCVDDASVATININAQPNAGTDGTTTICDSSTASIDLFGLITGEQAGGTWTRLTGTGGTFNAAAGTFVPAPGATNSTFQYFLPGTAPCVNDTSVATININAQPNAGTDGATTICDSSTASIDLFSLISGEQSGGTWTRLTGTGGTFNAAAGTFVPAPGATTSTFQYSLTATAPCINDASVATININAQPNAGTDGVTTICDSNTSTIDLFSLISGEQAGGTWTRLTGTGGTFNAASGTFVAATGATTSTFQYSLTGTAPCVDDVSVATININPQHIAGADGATTICDSNTASIDLFSLITGEQPGGIWTRLTGTGGTFNAAAGTFVPAPGATTSTFQYFLTGTAPCVDDVSVATVNINPQPNAGTDGATTICDSSTASIDLFGLISGEMAGGTWTRLTGTGGTFNAAAGTFVPAPGATTSTFQYFLAGTAPCVDDVSVITININAQPNAGTDGATTICDSNTASIDLYGLITGEQTGGTWIRLTGTGGTFNAAAGTFTPASGATTSTFQYSLTAAAPCVNDVSVATININPQPNAGTDGSTTICDSNTASIDLFGLITGEQAGGTWIRLTGTGGTFNAAAGTFVPAPGATTSTFQYSLAGTAPCINDVSVATININPQPNAGADGAATICDSNTSTIDLFGLITGEQAGGTWTRLTGTGGTFNAAAGTFVATTGATSSTFQYSLTAAAPCVDDVSVATININPQHIAGADGATTICNSSTASIDLFGVITGEQPGGTWTRLTGTGGTFNAAAGTFVPTPGATSSTFQYFLPGTAPCVNDVSVATININAQPNAGADGATTICDSNTASINLFGLITGEQAGGTWTRLTGTGGTFNAAAGTFVPTPGATSSTFQYSLTGAAPCVDDVSVATININAQPNAGTDGAATICDSNTATIDLFGLITGEQLGGTWTRLTGTGGTFNAAAGTFTPASGATTSTFQYSLTAIAPCVDDVSVATININPQHIAGNDGATTICDSSTAPIDLFGLITGEQAGGIWTRLTGTGGTFNAASGTFVPAPGATSSTFQYFLPGTAPCVNDVSVATININPQPNAGADGATTICDSSIASINLFGLIIGEQTGGTWIRLTGTGGTFNAAAGTFVPAPGATTSTFQYSLTAIAPCINDVSVATININPQPNAGNDGATTICDSSAASIDLFSIITGEQSGGTWTRLTGTGGTFNAASGTFVPAPGATSSTFQYFLPGTAPCVNDVSVATININPQPNAGADGATTICDSSTASINLFGLIIGEQTGGTWIRLTGTGGTFNAAAGTFVPAPGATTSSFQYSLTAIAPCVDDVSVATININAQPNAGTDGATTICDSNTSAIDLFGLITGEQSGGTWTRLTGTGGIFNAAAGTFVPAPGATTSTFQYFLPGTAPCINDVSVVTVNINAQPNAGADGSTTICDSSTTSIDLFGLITGEQTGGAWTRLTGTGGTFNAAAGTFTPTSGATTSTFQYFLSGTAPCVNDVSVATININPQPNAGADGATTICDSSQTSIDLFGLISGEQAGGTWTRLSGTGGTFNAAAGTFTPAPGATTSTFKYNLTAIAPCVDDMSVATININPQPHVIVTQVSQTICSGVTTNIALSSTVPATTYAWTVVQTGVTGASNGNGNTISQMLTVSGPTAGTAVYTVTPTANGCVGIPIEIVIVVNPTPTLTATPLSGSICSGQSTSISLSSNIVGTTYSWTVSQAGVTGATAGSGTTISQVLTATGNVLGTVTYTITPILNGCSGTPINVPITVTPGATINAIATATSICSGETATVTFTSNLPGTIYSWNVVQASVTGASNGTGSSISQVLTTIGNTAGQVAYTITPVTNGCPGTPVTAIINVNPIPIVTASPSNQTVCSGTATNIVLASNLPNTTFTWNVIQNGVYGAASGSGSLIHQTLSTVALVPGVVNYIITPHTNGCAGMPVTVTVAVNPTPEVFGNPSDTVICSKESAEFSLIPNIPGTTFTWTVVQNGVTGASDGSGNSNPVFVSQLLETTGATAGTAIYTITPSLNGCYGNPITITFTVNPLPQPQIQNGSICINQVTGAVLSTYALETGLSDSGHDFVWFLDGVEIQGATGSVYVADQPGFYSVLASNSVTGCVSEPVEVTVTESFPGQALNLYLNEAFSDNQIITAVVTGGSGNYEYQLDGGAYQTSNVFSGVSGGWHEVHVIDENNCTNLTQSIFVISYPRFFTPNGDGYNDSWNIWDLKDQPNAEIFIFDRYGKLIKQIASTGEGWDGTYNGHPLPSTDYWFTVKFKDGVNRDDRIFRSHFAMKR